MKTYLKTLERTFKKHITRLLSIILMVLVSVGFVSGIGSASDKIRDSLSDFYKSSNVSDFIVKDSSGAGFSHEDISAFEKMYGSENVSSGLSLDCYMPIGGEEQLVRLYFVDLDFPLNTPEYQSGEKPDGKYKALSEAADKNLKGISAGEKITLDFGKIIQSANDGADDGNLSDMLGKLSPTEVEISGVISSPLTFGQDGEPSYKNPENVEIPKTTGGVNSLICLENIIYLPKSVIPVYGDMPLPDNVAPFITWETLGIDPTAPLLPEGDIFVRLPDRNCFYDFSPQYKSYTDKQAQLIEQMPRSVNGETSTVGESARILTLYDNYSFSALHSYGEKVMLIGYVLMAAFLFVTALVVLSTMTRMLEEERSQIACLSTLGYSPFKIIFKYLLFAAIATGLGGVGAYFIGLGIADLIYFVFNYSFDMPPMSPRVAIMFFLIIFTIIVITTLSATAIAGRKLTSENPANLLRPKPPKAGRKTVIEKIPLIWNRLSFKYKSTTRNVLRYRNRFVMTVVAVAISTALVLAGLALLDLCLFQGVDSPSIMMVAIVVVVFAGLLTAVVIYTLTNINISERNRELATLMVLGYYDGEVAGYIYREIYIDVIVGIIFGYPLSTLIMYFLFEIMSMGSFATVSWFIWLIASAVVLIFTAVVTLLLRRKIVRIDMNESLKAVE